MQVQVNIISRPSLALIEDTEENRAFEVIEGTRDKNWNT